MRTQQHGSRPSHHAGPGHDVAQLPDFVRRRLADATRSREPGRAAWAESSLDILAAMEVHLHEAPPSVYEVRRFLLRTAALHREHVDYQGHWDLDMPTPKRR